MLADKKGGEEVFIFFLSWTWLWEDMTVRAVAAVLTDLWVKQRGKVETWVPRIV